MGLACFDESLTFDGYLYVTGARGIVEGYGYTNFGAELWPPLYPLLIALVGYGPGFVFGAKLISALSAAALMVALPFLSDRLGGSLVPGIVAQFVLVAIPAFTKLALQTETHMLDACLFTWAVYFGVRYLQSDSLVLPVAFLVVALAACLTRYTSWGLIVAFFGFLGLRCHARQKWNVFFSSIGLVVLVYSPWLIYRGIQSGVITPQKWRAIGDGIVKQGLVEFSRAEWWLIEQFHYSSNMDLFAAYPYTLLWNVGLNGVDLLRTVVLGASPFGFYAWFAGLGVIATIGQSFRSEDRSEHRFLIVVLLFVVFNVIVSIVRWWYFLHVGAIFGTAGLSYLYRYVESDVSWFPDGRNGGLIVLIVLVVLGGSYRGPALLDGHENLYLSKLRPNDSKAKVREQLRRYRKARNVPAGSIRVMSFFVYLPQVYQTGFRPVLLSLPLEDPVDLFCYGGMKPAKRSFFLKHNYPPGLDRSEYVPPDYVLIGPPYRRTARKQSWYHTQVLRKYLRNVDWWNPVPGVGFFGVKKDKINCF